METKTFIPNQNQQVLGMLAREFGKWNRGRNRILMSAVTLCIVTLTMVFGIASGKTKAEYIKAVRAEGINLLRSGLNMQTMGYIRKSKIFLCERKWPQYICGRGDSFRKTCM